MSIIYDALQKTQRNLENKKIPTSNAKVQLLDKSLLIVIAALVGINIFAYYPRLLNHFHANKVVSNVSTLPATKPASVSPVKPPTVKTNVAPVQIKLDTPDKNITQTKQNKTVNHPPVEALFAKPGSMPISSNNTVELPSNPKPTLAPSVKEIPYQGKMSLSGVFVSDQEKIAMINNQSFHLGDLVDGMKIVAIDIDTVKIADANNNVYVLRSAA